MNDDGFLKSEALSIKNITDQRSTFIRTFIFHRLHRSQTNSNFKKIKKNMRYYY